MSVKSLAEAVARDVQRRINAETRAIRGMIQADRFISGSKSYPMAQAVDWIPARKNFTIRNLAGWTITALKFPVPTLNRVTQSVPKYQFRTGITSR